MRNDDGRRGADQRERRPRRIALVIVLRARSMHDDRIMQT